MGKCTSRHLFPYGGFWGPALQVAVMEFPFRTHSVVKALLTERQRHLNRTWESTLTKGLRFETPQEIVDAIQSSGNVPGVDVTLCGSLQNQNPSLNVKIVGVSLNSNVQKNDGSLTVWGGIWNRTSPQVVQVPDLVKYFGDTAERMPNARFIKVKWSSV